MPEHARKVGCVAVLVRGRAVLHCRHCGMLAMYSVQLLCFPDSLTMFGALEWVVHGFPGIGRACCCNECHVRGACRYDGE